MNTLSCPNDGSVMENDEAASQRARARQHSVNHICGQCGYTESR